VPLFHMHYGFIPSNFLHFVRYLLDTQAKIGKVFMLVICFGVIRKVAQLGGENNNRASNVYVTRNEIFFKLK
jgi:hypothetical protein